MIGGEVSALVRVGTRIMGVRRGGWGPTRREWRGARRVARPENTFTAQRRGAHADQGYGAGIVPLKVVRGAFEESAGGLLLLKAC
jgi:hypothetical protein